MKCNECGIFKETGGFMVVEPSDCHDSGGHYQTHYDDNGKYLWSDVPWQIRDKADLSATEMELAIYD